MDKHWFKQMAEFVFVLGIVAADDKEYNVKRVSIEERVNNFFAGHCEGYY